jgi:hypothetical protein
MPGGHEKVAAIAFRQLGYVAQLPHELFELIKVCPCRMPHASSMAAEPPAAQTTARSAVGEHERVVVTGEHRLEREVAVRAVGRDGRNDM